MEETLRNIWQETIDRKQRELQRELDHFRDQEVAQIQAAYQINDLKRSITHLGEEIQQLERVIPAIEEVVVKAIAQAELTARQKAVENAKREMGKLEDVIKDYKPDQKLADIIQNLKNEIQLIQKEMKRKTGRLIAKAKT